MHVERTTTIERPIEEVFEYVSTPENDPTWVSASLRHERTSPGPMRVGTTTEEDVRFLGRTATYTWEVTEYEPPTTRPGRVVPGGRLASRYRALVLLVIIHAFLVIAQRKAKGSCIRALDRARSSSSRSGVLASFDGHAFGW